MKSSLAVLLVFGSSHFANANMNCRIHEFRPRSVSKLIFETVIEPSDDQDSIQMVYIKRDGSVVKLSYGEVKKKRSFKSLNLAKFFSFAQGTSGNLSVGYGDVNIDRKIVRQPIASADGSDSVVLNIWMDRYTAVCSSRF